MTDNAIVTENLTKVYGKLTAVDHVTLNVASGTVFGLLGPNGAGKTTMIKLLTGLADMTEGDATVAGFNVRRDPMHVKQRIGWVASEVILDDDFTAWENLWLQSKLQSLPNWKDRAGDLLEYFGLKDRRKDRVKTFSTACGRNSRSPSPCFTNPRSSSWTSRRSASTRTRDGGYGTSSPAATRSSESRSC